MRVLRRLSRDKLLYVMVLPGLLYFAIFKYVPMWGVLMAFQDFKPHLGFWQNDWVGLKHFNRFFGEPEFWMLFRNTMVLGIYNLVFFFPLPIALALLLNEVRRTVYKRFVQTLLYVPHFVSWVVVVGIYYIFFTTEGGVVNVLIQAAGGTEVPFLMEPGWFRTLVTSQVIWKETGWGTIIFLAALAGVDPGLYESARIDGANRWRRKSTAATTSGFLSASCCHCRPRRLPPSPCITPSATGTNTLTRCCTSTVRRSGSASSWTGSNGGASRTIRSSYFVRITGKCSATTACF
ncbi:ABC transporter permease subunit [Paenibacillus hemerocallicola]